VAAVVERAPGSTSFVDVLDRMLDKGVVIDYWARASVVGIDLVAVEARMVVASIDLQAAGTIGVTAPLARWLSQSGIAGGSGVTDVALADRGQRPCV
jgi:hypothetical protein